MCHCQARAAIEIREAAADVIYEAMFYKPASSLPRSLARTATSDHCEEEEAAARKASERAGGRQKNFSHFNLDLLIHEQDPYTPLFPTEEAVGPMPKLFPVASQRRIPTWSLLGCTVHLHLGEGAPPSVCAAACSGNQSRKVPVHLHDCCCLSTLPPLLIFQMSRTPLRGT